MRFTPALFRSLLLGLCALHPLLARGEVMEFNLPAQPAADALLAFSQQAKVEVLFSFDKLRSATATAVAGRYEPEEALNHLLRDTGLVARRNGKGKFVVTPAPHPTGSIKGRLLTSDGDGARGVRVTLASTHQATRTGRNGEFTFSTVPPGSYQLAAEGPGYQPLLIEGVKVEAARVLALETQTMRPASDLTQLEPYLVQGQSNELPIGRNIGAAPRQAAGNIDLPRTEDNALPFTIYTREQIARSGVVQLNEFFQRELLETTTTRPPPEQDGTQASYVAGSSNLSLRGYEDNETVVLVNGRRLPETLSSNTGVLGPPDVNLIPLSLVQQVEVLPVSASALYSGNAVGGVINIVLRPEADATEVRLAYTNALGRFDAPQSSISLQHGQTLLDGRLRLRFNATVTRTMPALERELGHRQARLAAAPSASPFRATPNVRSADSTPLFGPDTATFTSVAPGADGSGGLTAFASREGVASSSLFDSPGSLAASFNSLDYPYGRRQRRAAYFGSAVYDLFPWLQLGLDGTYARTVINRGLDVFTGDLDLRAGAPLNPFPQEVVVSLNETAPRLGENYSEAHLESCSAVLGLLLKLPADWRVSFDAQYARNLARYRGLIRADSVRWQQLVDRGLYQPLRDTQVHGPPQEFYDQVLVYYGGPGRFVTLGDYDTLDVAGRVANESLALPTGKGTASFGGDYRRNHLAGYSEEPRFADGTLAGTQVRWTGRTLERISVFGELQAPLYPAARLPRWIKGIETDLAVRYIVSANSNETNLAPTAGLKLDLAGGFSLRSSFTTSNRFPTAQMSRPIDSGSGGSAVDTAPIFDPVRNESYDVSAQVAINPNVRPEAAVTQTAGLIYQRGQTHRFRASLDFADTRKTNEFIALGPQALLNLESLFPERVQRAPAGAGRVVTVFTGAVNGARRHSQNWNGAVDYAWNGFMGGTLELRGRWVWFQRYDRQLFPNSPMVDELGAPDGTAPGLLRHRLNFSAGWSTRDYGFGVDGHYLNSRILPVAEQPSQGSDRIKPYWQFDAYVQSDLTRWLPWKHKGLGLSGQLRINNISGFDFPKYANDASGSGLQPYGDWRGRTYSLSITATF